MTMKEAIMAIFGRRDDSKTEDELNTVTIGPTNIGPGYNLVYSPQIPGSVPYITTPYTTTTTTTSGIWGVYGANGIQGTTGTTGYVGISGMYDSFPPEIKFGFILKFKTTEAKVNRGWATSDVSNFKENKLKKIL